MSHFLGDIKLFDLFILHRDSCFMQDVMMHHNILHKKEILHWKLISIGNKATRIRHTQAQTSPLFV